jgi:hypothetical protein
MSDTSGYERFNAEVLRIFADMALSLSSANKKQSDFFDTLYVDGEKPFIELKSLYDGAKITCYTKEELEKGMTDIVRNTEMFESLKNRTAGGSVLTVSEFNALGGHRSDLLAHAISIERQSDHSLQLNLAEGTSRPDNIAIDDDEIKKSELKKAGIQWDDLSFSDRKRLKSGKETSTLTIAFSEKNGRNRHVRGKLSLKANPDNTFSFAFRQAQNQNKAKRFWKI